MLSRAAVSLLLFFACTQLRAEGLSRGLEREDRAPRMGAEDYSPFMNLELNSNDADVSPVPSSRLHPGQKDFVLFIDLNLNPREVMAAEEALRATGDARRLVVIPGYTVDNKNVMTEYNRLKHSRLPAEREQAVKLATQIFKDPQSGGGLKGPALIARTLDKLAAGCFGLGEQWSVTDSCPKKVPPPKLHPDLVSTVMVSAHHWVDGRAPDAPIGAKDRPAAFWTRRYGEVTNQFLAQQLKRHHEIGANLKHLALLGCYTLNDTERRYWKSEFEKIEVISGYDLKAPAEDKTAGPGTVDFLLRQEQALLEAARTRDLSTVTAVMAVETPWMSITRFKACIGEGAVTGRGFVENSEKDLERRCVESEFEAAGYQALAKQLVTPDSIGWNLPSAGALTKDKLRSVYNFVSEAQACPWFDGLWSGLPRTEPLLAAIFYPDVVAQFWERRRALLAQVKAQKNTSSEALRILNVDYAKLTRKDFLKLQKELESGGEIQRKLANLIRLHLVSLEALDNDALERH